MRMLAIPASLLALALLAGCAQMRSGTGTMGAAPSTANVYCRDGAWETSAARCNTHGGVERIVSTPETSK